METTTVRGVVQGLVCAILTAGLLAISPSAQGAYPGANGKIAFEEGVPRRVIVANADGSNRMDLGPGSDPAWSPDGTKIAFALSPDIWVMNADGSGRRPLTDDPAPTHRVSSPTWSPDGTRIAFNVDGTRIFVVAAGGGIASLLVDPPPVTVGALAWSPLGDRIAFGTNDIWLVSADGSNPVNITNSDDKYERDPDWKPDGSRLVFERGQPEEIWTMNPDGTGQTNITPPGGSSQAGDPAWSPDGTKIVLVFHGIRVMNPDATGLTPVLTSGLRPDWQPVRPAAVAGAAFFIDGTSTKAGPSGATVSVFATSAEPGFSYRLVSGHGTGQRPCSTDVVALNDTLRFANAEGVIGRTSGTLNRPAGEWQICFLAEGQVVTGAATYTVSA